MLKVTNKGKKKKEEQKEVMKRRGRTSRNKGASFERVVAKTLEEALGVEFVRTPQSGGFAKNKNASEGFKGDIVPVDKDVDFKLHVECKNAKQWKLPAWLSQAESDCPEGKIAVVVFHKAGTNKEGSAKDYIALSLEDFLDLIPEGRVV